MPDEYLSGNKVLRTAEVARELGVQPGVFLRLAREAGIEPRKKGRHHLWSEADAFCRLQRGATNRRVPMIDLATEILNGKEVAQ